MKKIQEFEAQNIYNKLEYLTSPIYDPEVQSMAIMGETQTGKTTHSVSIVHMLAHSGFNVIVLDNKRKFTKVDPTKVIHTMSDIRGKGLEILQPYKFESIIKMRNFFEDLSYVVYSMKNIIFVVDELHSWFHDIRSHVDGFELFVKECHNEKSSLVSIFQSPSEIPKYVFTNAHHKFCLYVDSERDVKTCISSIGREVEIFRYDVVPKYEGFYKARGEPIKKFRVEKL